MKKYKKHIVKKSANYPVDKQFLALVGILLLFGLFMVYESSNVFSLNNFGFKYKFVVLQFTWIIVGLIGAYFLSKIDLDFIKNKSKLLYLITLGLLLFTLLKTPFAPEVYGAKRWFVINPSPIPLIPWIGRLSFQPSELAKLVSIIFLSAILAKKNILKGVKNYKKEEMGRLFIILITIFIVVGLIILEPDFTTAFVILTVLFGMYILAGAPLKYLIIGIPGTIISAIGYAFSSEYRRLRIMTLFNPDSIDSQGAGYHIRQIMITLGSGGLLGLGAGMSKQKYFYLPEPTSDSIFAIVGEEFGFIGATLLIIVFAQLVMRGFAIGKNARDDFSRYLVYGIMLWFSVQLLINLGVMGRMLPVTGIPLPLISYGGSSMIFILWSFGFVLNVSRYAKLKK